MADRKRTVPGRRRAGNWRGIWRGNRRWPANAGWWTGLVLFGGALVYALERMGRFLEDAGEGPPVTGPDASRPSGRIPDPEALELRHEPDKVNVKALAWLGAGLVVCLAILLACLWGLQSLLGHAPDRPDLRPMALPQAGAPVFSQGFRARAPGLFPDPTGDLRRFREREATEAPVYGWVDRQKGIVGIPVERAMELIAERGLPAWDFPGVTGDFPGVTRGAAAGPDTGRQPEGDSPTVPGNGGKNGNDGNEGKGAP